MDFKIIGAKGTIDVQWNEVKLKTTYDLNEKIWNTQRNK